MRLFLRATVRDGWTTTRPCGVNSTRFSNLRHISTATSEHSSIAAMLATPSWSVKSLIEISDDSSGTSITSKQLHHLLRLSALPLPSSEEEEAKMIQNLESQLHFVRAVQEVDTSGIEPLQCIRDETLEAEQENEINMETLKADFEKEEVVGSSRRVRKKRKDMIDTTSEEDWDALAQAPKTIGRYIVVNASKN